MSELLFCALCCGLAASACVLRMQGSPVVGPGGLDPQAARLKQQLVPAPERIWALRNVANSMLRSATFGAAGSSGSSAAAGGDAADSISPAAEEALSMLRQAAYLAADHYGDNHPGGCTVAFWGAGQAALRVRPPHASVQPQQACFP